MVAAGELFHRLGFDWTMFYAQAIALRSGNGARMYDLSEIDRQLQLLAPYYMGPATFHAAQPVPYPPWFAAAIVPFTLPPPPLGFALWEGASILAGLYLAHRVRQFLPEFGLISAALIILAAIPIATALYTGQVAVLLAVAVGEMYVSFKARKDFRAGLWLAVLLLKPQYGLLFGLVILWKWRPRAIAGVIVGGLMCVLVGVVAAGTPAFLGLPTALAQMGEFIGPFGGPWWMINWRAIVLAVRPGIGDQAGVALVGLLSLATMAACLWPWRKQWDPDAPAFGTRFCLLTLGALITSYHSHLHGAALLVVPLAAAWSEPTLRPITRLAVLTSLYAPTLFLLWIAVAVQRLAIASNPDVPLWLVWPAALPAVLFLLTFAVMSLDLLPERAADGSVQ
jgi:hypothetical protein